MFASAWMISEPNCDPRHKDDWTTTEVQQVSDAIDLIKMNCSDEGNMLLVWNATGRVILWDGRVKRGGTLRGRADPVTADVYLWTGYIYDPNEDGSKPINWAETLAHEILHAQDILDGVKRDHDWIRSRASQCAGL